MAISVLLLNACMGYSQTFLTIKRALRVKCLQEFGLSELEFSEIDMIDIPKCVQKIVSSESSTNSTAVYNENYHLIHMLLQPPTEPFQFQCRVDRGDVND